MQGDEGMPTVSRGLLRLGTLFAILAVGSYILWEMFSETAALDSLAATAENFQYSESCDSKGNLISLKPANCVDLNHYVFIYGPVMKAVRRDCNGKSAAMLRFEKGAVSRAEIATVEKMLRFRAQNGMNSPCGSYR